MTAKAPGYLEWIRLQPCRSCRAPGPSQAHHAKGFKGLSGVGLKAPDLLSMPLCPACHDDVHNAKGFQAQEMLILDVLIKAITEGVIVYGFEPDELPDLW